jgi:hypothetical protein
MMFFMMTLAMCSGCAEMKPQHRTVHRRHSHNKVIVITHGQDDAARQAIINSLSQ